MNQVPKYLTPPFIITNKNILEETPKDLTYVWSKTHKRIFKTCGPLELHDVEGDDGIPTILVDVDDMQDDFIILKAENTFGLQSLPKGFMYKWYAQQFKPKTQIMNTDILKQDIQSLEFFIVRNQEGKYFRSKGYGGSGDSWISEIKKAKVYQKIGPARSVVTWFTSNFPKYGMPDIIHIKAGEVTILDEKKRVEKTIDKKKKKEMEKEKKRAEYNLKIAQQRVANAQAELQRSQSKLAEQVGKN